MPKPNKQKETKKEYISRCMSDGEMKSKYPDTPRRYAVCNSLWDNEGDSKTKKKDSS